VWEPSNAGFSAKLSAVSRRIVTATHPCPNGIQGAPQPLNREVLRQAVRDHQHLDTHHTRSLPPSYRTPVSLGVLLHFAQERGRIELVEAAVPAHTEVTRGR